PQQAAPQILEHAEAMKDRGDLEAARQAEPVDPVRRQAIDARRAKVYLAGRNGKSAADEIEQSRLAGPVRANQGVTLPGRDVQAHAANDLGGTEILAHIAQRDDWRGHRAASG